VAAIAELPEDEPLRVAATEDDKAVGKIFKEIPKN
jgi:polyribonucleotide nucleotidyltransferase